ncbi:MAG: Zn-ribbon domain-containing OB-fold protein [Chloroflexota bacterium]
MAENNQPLPFTASSFNRFLGEQQLRGARCRSCGALHLPPRPICITCHGEDMEWVELSGQGKLIAFTTVHIAPTAMIEAGYGRDKPYCTGIVQLQEGPAISAQILGVDATQPESIAIGTPLRATFIERGEGEGRRTFLAFKL